MTAPAFVYRTRPVTAGPYRNRSDVASSRPTPGLIGTLRPDSGRPEGMSTVATTIDVSRRCHLREAVERLGLSTPCPVEVTRDGPTVVIRPVTQGGTSIDTRGRLTVPEPPRVLRR